MSELIQGIRLIKYFTWEQIFSARVKNIRELELTEQYKITRARYY
jgi:hypothetical protein